MMISRTTVLAGTLLISGAWFAGSRSRAEAETTRETKVEAQKDLEKRVKVHAATLAVTVNSISMRSQTTRWGSCSTAGKLNFNWRLILAPHYVLDYVAAHEVAHLVEMNHSQAFWDVVESTLPTMARGGDWLKGHGRGLMVYGIDN